MIINWIWFGQYLSFHTPLSDIYTWNRILASWKNKRFQDQWESFTYLTLGMMDNDVLTPSPPFFNVKSSSNSISRWKTLLISSFHDSDRRISVRFVGVLFGFTSLIISQLSLELSSPLLEVSLFLCSAISGKDSNDWNKWVNLWEREYRNYLFIT